MSKAQELADKLGKEIGRTVAHDVLMHDALTELRRLDRVNAELTEELRKGVAMLIELGGSHMDHKPEKFRRAILEYARSGGAALSSSGGTES